MVHPRTLRHKLSNKMSFKVNVLKLRAAFAWLKKHNGYYQNVAWEESSVRAWSSDSVIVGTMCEEDFLSEQPVPENNDEFRRWIGEAECAQDVGDAGFQMGQRMLALLQRQVDDSNTSDHWSLLRALAADLRSSASFGPPLRCRRL